MRTSSRFTVAVHILSVIAIAKEVLCTSEFIAASVNTNPVVIRRLIAQLKQAGFIGVYPGTGGAYLTKGLEEITLLAVYRAVEKKEQERLFRFHEKPNPHCPIGANLQEILEKFLWQAQVAMEEVLENITLASVIATLQTKIS
ncbi:MAG: Rrf2 family transcriptional regulator [Sporomusaceae bacterium]|nr:Rrf2 family transcriptional regulator [Sporomusaceae bacterium]